MRKNQLLMNRGRVYRNATSYWGLGYRDNIVKNCFLSPQLSYQNQLVMLGQTDEICNLVYLGSQQGAILGSYC